MRPALPFFADSALEDGFYEYRAVLLDNALDLFLAGVGAEDLGRRKSCELQQLRAAQHASDFHGSFSSRGVFGSVGLQSAAPILQEPVALGLVEIGQQLRPDPDRPDVALLFDGVGRNIVAHGAE